MGTLACAVGELWALVNLLRPLERRDFSSRVAAKITASTGLYDASVLALPLGGHDARSRGPADDALLWSTRASCGSMDLRTSGGLKRGGVRGRDL